MEKKATPWATVEEAADAFRVSKQTVRRMCRAGRLDARRVGKQWRIPRRVLDPELQQKRQGVFTPPGYETK